MNAIAEPRSQELSISARAASRISKLIAEEAGDGLMLNRAIAESFLELNRWMDWAATMPTIIESERFVRDSAARFLRREDLPLFLRRRDSGELVGASGMHRIDWQVPRFEIGYWCRTSLVGNGYVGEAVAAITRFAFEKLGAARVEIRTDSQNTRSFRVAERLGFRLGGLMRRDARTPQGALRDTRLYSMVDLADLRSH
jgi:RimJ/RimL family protein N-acetyltransferase